MLRHCLAPLSLGLFLALPSPLAAQGLLPDGRRVPAPAFDLPVWSPDAGTASTRLALDSLRGQVVLLDFWARWCIPCIPIHQALVEQAPQWLPHGVRILSVLTLDSANGLEGFFATHGGRPPFPVLMDPGGTLLASLDHAGLPATVLLDHEGRVAWQRAHLRPSTDLPRLLPPLLAERDGRRGGRDPNRLGF